MIFLSFFVSLCTEPKRKQITKGNQQLANMSRFFVVLAAIAIVPAVYSYSAGAPADACGNLTPQHHVDPQRSSPPYILEVSKNSIKAGDIVELTLRGQKPSNTFKGFFVQARVGGIPVGQFKIDPAYKYAQALSCEPGSNVSFLMDRMSK